jgi:ribosomal protein L28
MYVGRQAASFALSDGPLLIVVNASPAPSSKRVEANLQDLTTRSEKKKMEVRACAACVQQEQRTYR